MKEEVSTVVNDWTSYPIIWVCAGIVIFLILLLIKLYSMSRTTQKSFKDLSNKIDSLYRTSDAFNELNSKIDNLNRSTNELKRTTTDVI
jgi:cell division protein FtsL